MADVIETWLWSHEDIPTARAVPTRNGFFWKVVSGAGSGAGGVVIGYKYRLKADCGQGGEGDGKGIKLHCD